MMNTYENLIKALDEVADYLIEILGEGEKLSREEVIHALITPAIEDSRKFLKLSKEEVEYLFGNPFLPDFVIQSKIDKLTQDRM